MRIVLSISIILLVACTKEPSVVPLFSDITDESGVVFENSLKITEEINPYTYRNFFNGAGVAIGDVNNDGLEDIYFAGNQVSNKLYLNEGNLKFKDITTTAGVACEGAWSTGVSFIDVNADGFLDIYVCKSGDPNSPNRKNELFINNGDLTFSERAHEYGLDIMGLSVQAAFFDFDKDGDLDCYILTNSIKSIGSYDLIKDQRLVTDINNGGNKFLINENGKFIEKTRESGIYNSAIGFGLGITLGDFNDDGWIDIFVSNDFFERDYLYINNQRGGFDESLTDYFESISMGSMGADFADLDNDEDNELFVTEMLPDSLTRKKTKTVFESWNKFESNVANGYHYQVSRNVLQKRIINKQYSEIGRFSGVASTEWSWGALIFDMDNDGYKDIFVANGISKDLLDRDYLAYTGSRENVKKIIETENEAIIKLIELMPSSIFLNYAFKNEGALRFVNYSAQWGLNKPMISSGSSYADLDNDGDLDLIINNSNASSIIYRNNTDSSVYKSLGISFINKANNTPLLGTKVSAYSNGQVFSSDNFIIRGFQSAVTSNVVLGLGKNVSKIDSLKVMWPDGIDTILYNVRVNSKLKVEHLLDSKKYIPSSKKKKNSVIELSLISEGSFKHKGNVFNEFNRDRLLPFMLENEMPKISKADIDGDGKFEFYIGGGMDQHGEFFRIESDDKVVRLQGLPQENKMPIETDGHFFDADGDGDLDFYLANGGRFYPKSSSNLEDKLFINQGKLNFTSSAYNLPFSRFVSTSSVKSIDFDRDGDKDLIVAERYDPFIYGAGGGVFLFQNQGNGNFTDVTSKVAPMFNNVGMTVDIQVADVNNDGWDDVLMIGDWMPIRIFINESGKLIDASNEMGFANTRGWWRDIASGDLNKDGIIDFVIGNHGLNTFFKEKDRMYVGDFDSNGSVEQIFCTNISGKYFPITDRDDLLSQLPSLKKSLLYYKDYSKKSIDELFTADVLATAKIYEVDILSSVMLLSSASGYQIISLPKEAQYSPIFAVLVLDADKDGVEDILAGGNVYSVKPQFGRFDASEGWYFKGHLKDGNFSLSQGESLSVKGEIRDIQTLKVDDKDFLLFSKYNDELEIYKIQR
jgi:hypothetical protein